MVKETLEELEISPSQFILQRKENIRKYYKFKDKIGEGIINSKLKAHLEKSIRHIIFLPKKSERLSVYLNHLLVPSKMPNSSKKSIFSKHL